MEYFLYNSELLPMIMKSSNHHIITFCGDGFTVTVSKWDVTISKGIQTLELDSHIRLRNSGQTTLLSLEEVPSLLKSLTNGRIILDDSRHLFPLVSKDIVRGETTLISPNRIEVPIFDRDEDIIYDMGFGTISGYFTARRGHENFRYIYNPSLEEFDGKISYYGSSSSSIAIEITVEVKYKSNNLVAIMITSDDEQIPSVILNHTANGMEVVNHPDIVIPSPPMTSLRDIKALVSTVYHALDFDIQ
jgi:hypothetical protein